MINEYIIIKDRRTVHLPQVPHTRESMQREDLLIECPECHKEKWYPVSSITATRKGFCNQSCASSFNGKKRLKKERLPKMTVCVICEKKFEYKGTNKRKTCSDECLKKRHKEATAHWR